MQYFQKNLARPNVTLTGYIHDKSSELSNADRRPAVLVFPGGGYFSCSDREAEPVALAFLGEGYQAFVLRYTVGQTTPFADALADAQEAFDYLQQNADELCVDADRIAVCGFSAGGHLAACMGTVSRNRPAAMILGYPVILSDFGKSIKKDIPSADLFVDGSTPPAYLFTTSSDELVPVENTLKMAAALDRAAVPFELHIFPEGPHGLSLAKPHTSDGKEIMVNPRVQEWFPECCKWLTGVWGSLETTNDDPGLGMTRHEIGIDMPLALLMERPDCAEVLNEIVPGLDTMLQASPSAGNYSLSVMNRFSPEIITDDILKEAKAKLAGCKPIEK
jgi:acetyl esterase/lipase